MSLPLPRRSRWDPPWVGAAVAPARVVDDRDELLTLEGAWNALCPPDGPPTRQFAWVRACAEAFGDAGPLRVFTLSRGRELAAVAPLIERRFPAEKLEMLGARELHCPMDFSFADAAALETLAGSLVETQTAISLDCVAGDSPTLAAIEEACAGRGWVRVFDARSDEYIRLDPGWTDPESKLDPARRAELRRARHIAEHEGEVTFEIASPRSTAELRNLPLLGLDETRGEFFRRYARHAVRHGILRLAFLRVGGKVAAMQLAVEADERYWVLRIACDDVFAQDAPCNLLIAHTVAHAAARGLQTYEFLGAPDTHSERWTDRTRRRVALRAYPFNGPGYAALCIDEAAAAKNRKTGHD